MMTKGCCSSKSDRHIVMRVPLVECIDYVYESLLGYMLFAPMMPSLSRNDLRLMRRFKANSQIDMVGILASTAASADVARNGAVRPLFVSVWCYPM